MASSKDPPDPLVSNRNTDSNNKLTSDVFEGAECLINLRKSKRHKTEDSDTTNALSQPLPTDNEDNEFMDHSDLNNTEKNIGKETNYRTQTTHEYRYEATQRGPCKVIIECLANSHLADKDLDRFKYAKLLNNAYKNSIVDVKSSGFGKLSVMVKSAREANIILSDKSLEGMGLRASIPSYFVTCQGVIGGIPLELPESEIKENLVILSNTQSVKILDVRRLDRKIVDKDTNKVSYVPSRSILITFKGRTLPEKVAIYNASTNVEPYVSPVKICWKCLRYGHISKQCRSKARCKRCGDDAHTDASPCPNANGTPKCVHCSGPHVPNSRECPEYIFQRDFRSYAIYNCLTFVEAKAILRPRKSDKQPRNDSLFNANNYPGLRNVPPLTTPPSSPRWLSLKPCAPLPTLLSPPA